MVTVRLKDCVEAMVKEKVIRLGDRVEVVYSEEKWKIFRDKRRITLKIMEALKKRGLNPIVHGSIARGDVSPSSDVDVVILNPTPPYLVEVALEISGYKVYHKCIVQATPNHTPKVYLYLTPEELECVSFPLSKLKPRELEFYSFGGVLEYERVMSNPYVRVPGVNKRLQLIIPTLKGHIEEPIIGREEEVAKILNISLETVKERVRVLTKRDVLGRTGVFIKKTLSPTASLEEEIENLKRENPFFRRALES